MALRHSCRSSAVILATAIAVVLLVRPVCAADLGQMGGMVLKAGAIGAAVSAAAPTLDKFINTVTLKRKVPTGTSTKVVPVLSVGEKAYVGAAQVCGPTAEVKRTKVIWLYEDNFSQNEFRLKVLVPAASINPVPFKRVQKVGVSAIIDVALEGARKGQTVSGGIGAGDILKAGAVGLAINAAANPLNKAINAVTGGNSAATRVVPIVTVGDKAYVGGVQVSGSSAGVPKTKVVYQYEDSFDKGRFRIKAFMPMNAINPVGSGRVQGVGMTALIDTSIADQESVRQRKTAWWNSRPTSTRIESVMKDRFATVGGTAVQAHDNGLHKGWYQGVGNQRKRLYGVWSDRYYALPAAERSSFLAWWNQHCDEDAAKLEQHWREWSAKRVTVKAKPSVSKNGSKSLGSSKANGKKGRA